MSFKWLGLGLICIILITIIFTSFFPSPVEVDKLDLYADMRAPVVRVLTKYAVWSVEIKPEFREPFYYDSDLEDTTRNIVVERGQRWIWLEPQSDEVFLPDVWVSDSEVYCGLPADNEYVKAVDKVNHIEECDDEWGVHLTEETDLLQRDDWDDVVVKGGKYGLKINPISNPFVGSQLVTVTYPYIEKLEEPYYYSLDEMIRTIDADKVVEQTLPWGSLGTGILGYSGSVIERKYTSRDGTRLRHRSPGWDYMDDTQSIFLTNWHMVAPLLDEGYHYNEDDRGNIYRAETVVDAKTFVQINKGGQWIPVNVGAHNENYDLAQLWVTPEIPKGPKVNWLPVSQQPQLGETAYVVGHPLGINDDTLGEGVIDSIDHVASPGEVLWGRARYLLTIPARGGSSGSPVYVIRDGAPYVTGILHAGYGSLYGRGEWDPSEDVTINLNFTPDDYEIEAPAEVEDPIFIPAPYHLIISIDDIADFVAESGQSWVGLTERFSY